MSTLSRDTLPHWMLMLRQWLKHPRRTAAIMPSGPDLAIAMIAELPAGTRRVIELGGGTGALTKALLAHGIAAQDLLVVELNDAMHARLQRRFPQVRIAHGDARQLRGISVAQGFTGDDAADAIISGLGVLSMRRDLQRDIYAAAFDCLRPGGCLIQFTYGPQPPLADEVARELGLEVSRGAFVLRNVPPATVYVYRHARQGQSATGSA
ncbi:phosphatidylethanolamine/phosphatidyl-N-methylethanolamine N-methyltransferase [Luteimonas cucumeris]|uniref:Phosphatidylethanolamine/phosphatidyl-N-methylethanolamine N-methyltransferase n=1 Tax=Luteimonas cucumeris TaxID=985012 RepID=A0A562KUG5_9GAMM|nr:methyltransferase domain-containing protein [Luteimonas cucumeris]TWH99069.1 phosphatidylethanolamine/phosphatidyl-N-methylethanolamine N-methyltransferase [Luteimonas cucumeris]